MSALTGTLVIEIAERVAGEQTGRLLALSGAEVIKIERPGGAPSRQMGPFHQGTSTLFGYLNAGKKSLVLDLAQAEDRATLDALLAKAQVLIDDHDEAWGAERGLTSHDISTRHPHLIHTIITAFGQGSPQAWQQARPLNVINAGGWAYHSPSEAQPDRPPLKGAGRFLSDYEAAIDTTLCIMAALHRQHSCGLLGGHGGQFIDISEVEVQLNRNDAVLGRMLAGEAEPSHARSAYDMGGPATCFACGDGHVYLFMTTKAHWAALCALMGQPQWAQDFPEDWLEFHCTAERVAQFRQNFRPWIAQQSKHPITEAAQQAGLAMVPIQTAADLPLHPQFIHRGFYQDLEGAAYPTVPYRMSASPVRVSGHAPELGG